MITFTRILCPIDFSEISMRALLHATTLARWYAAQLDVLHVVPAYDHDAVGQPVPIGAPGEMFIPPLADALVAELQRVVDAAGAAAIHPRLLVQHGRVHETIVSHAHSGAADLLVIGTHGRGGFQRLFLGSVTEKVIRTATCPVMTIPPSAAAPPDAPVAFRKVLCAIDYSPSSLAALRYALELARQSNGSVTVLHTLEYMEPAEPCEHVDAGVRVSRRHIIEHARDRLHQTVAGEPQTWCEIQEVLALNAHRAYDEILSRAAASGADLIVMGAQGSDGVELTLYGSNTHHVVRGAACPVLTVRR